MIFNYKRCRHFCLLKIKMRETNLNKSFGFERLVSLIPLDRISIRGLKNAAAMQLPADE